MEPGNHSTAEQSTSDRPESMRNSGNDLLRRLQRRQATIDANKPQPPDQSDVTPNFDAGDRVSWDRGEMPRGFGTIKETKVHGKHVVHMVRDKTGNTYAFHEVHLTRHS